MKNLKKLSRNDLKKMTGGLIKLTQAGDGEGRFWKCCKESTSPEQCGGCGESGCNSGYYAQYC